MNYVVRLYIDKDRLAATCTASVFILIGPAVGYTGAGTQDDSVHQNCVLVSKCVC